MEPSASTPSVTQPGVKQTAKRTSNFEPWAGMGRRNAVISSIVPQGPSPTKMLSDNPRDFDGAASIHGSVSQQTVASQLPGQLPHGTWPPTQTPGPSTTPKMLKTGGLSTSGRIQAAQRQWEATQAPNISRLSTENQREGGFGSISQAASPVTDSAQSSKQHVESPVPLPHYAQALAHKRSAAYLSDTVETPGFKRRQIQHSINDTRHESPMSINPAPTSTSLVPTSFLSAARTVELDGRLVNVFGRTGNRKYNEYWLPSPDGQEMQLTAAGGALLPLEYTPLDGEEMPWICPVRDCRKRMGDLRALGGHGYSIHNTSAFNDNGDGTISKVGTYKRTAGRPAPPVIVSCEPISSDAPPARSPWIQAAPRDRTKPTIGQSPNLASHQLPETIEYLHQILSNKQITHQRDDVKYMRHLPRLRDLPNAWLHHHQSERLDHRHYAAALAYLVGEEVFGEDKCRQSETRATSRLSDKCIKLPASMPLEARNCFSKYPTCVGCRYWSHLQRRTNTCDWNHDQEEVGQVPLNHRSSKQARLLDDEDYNSTESSTVEDSAVSVDSAPPDIKQHYPATKQIAETKSSVPQEQADANTGAAKMDSDYEEPARSARQSQRPGRQAQPAVPRREASLGLSLERGPRSNAVPRMQEWEYGEGRLFDPSGRWAVAWSAPYNTGREPFRIGPNISIHRLRLGPSETYSWKAEADQFRFAEVHAGEIDLKQNGSHVGTLTQGAVFKIQPGDTCRIENHCVLEALVSVNVIGNYIRLSAD